eukprot:8796972-Pyramimonas_sp.AAC.1
MTKRNYTEVGVDYVGELMQSEKRQESNLPESWVTENLTKIQEAVWEGIDNFDSLDAILRGFITVQRAKRDGGGVNCLKTVEALTYALEVCTSVSTLAQMLGVLELLTREHEGVGHALKSATDHIAVKVTKEHTSIEDIQVPGLNLLANLSTDHGKGLDATVSAGILQVVLSALRTLPQSARVQEGGLRLLRNVTEIDDETPAVIGGGAADLAIGAMKRFPESEDVQANACGLLGNMAMCEEVGDVQLMLINSGAVEMVAAALKRHPDHE